MVKRTGCQCFTCRHSDEPRVIAGYLQGYIDASNWFINWAEKNNVKIGYLGEDTLEGIYAEMLCNRDESECLLSDMPNIEEDIEKGNLLWERRKRKRN
jgi:hypothetical protein